MCYIFRCALLYFFLYLRTLVYLNLCVFRARVCLSVFSARVYVCLHSRLPRARIFCICDAARVSVSVIMCVRAREIRRGRIVTEHNYPRAANVYLPYTLPCMYIKVLLLIQYEITNL